MTKISIIVPIYNVEKYLEQCLQSIQEQSFRDLEVILINDGSTDNSLEICESFKKKDKRFIIIDIPNGGVSSARNLGLQKAKGEYITFLDPDDWIDTDMYKVMYNQTLENNAEVSMCGFKSITGNNVINYNILIDKNRMLLRDEIVDYLIPNLIGPTNLNSGSETIMGNVWRLLIKRQVVLQNGLSFDKNITLMEDLIFCLNLFFKVNRVYLMKECFYNYRIGEQSAAHRYRENFIDIQLDVYDMVENIVKKQGLYDEYKVRLDNRYYDLYIWTIRNEMNSKNKASLIKKLSYIKCLCSDKKLQDILNNIEKRNFTFRKKFLIEAIKYKKSSLIYLYYKFVFLIS